MSSKEKVVLLMEHFAFNQQGLLDSFQRGEISVEDLYLRYKETGIENHEIPKYKGLLELARDSGGKV